MQILLIVQILHIINNRHIPNIDIEILHLQHAYRNLLFNLTNANHLRHEYTT